VSIKVLVAEDNVDNLQLLSTLLSLNGYTVIPAENGSEALTLLESHRPDLIIADVSMPVLNGIDMIRTLRQKRENRKIPVIVLSAYANGMKHQALEVGADLVMAKPAQFDLLLEAVEQLLISRKDLS
jgi:CheY-like chemotaxis protein